MATTFTSLKTTGILTVAGAFVLGLGGGAFFASNLSDGTEVIRVNRQIIFSGSELNIVGTLTEDDRIGGGAKGLTQGTMTGWVIQNPHSEELLIKGVTLYVTTAGETTIVDISRGTGSIAAGTNAATGTTLGNNVTLAADVINLSGSLLNPATGKNFVLDARGGTNDHIIIASTSTEAGSGTVIKYHINAYQFE